MSTVVTKVGPGHPIFELLDVAIKLGEHTTAEFFPTFVKTLDAVKRKGKLDFAYEGQQDYGRFVDAALEKESTSIIVVEVQGMKIAFYDFDEAEVVSFIKDTICNMI